MVRSRFAAMIAGVALVVASVGGAVGVVGASSAHRPDASTTSLKSIHKHVTLHLTLETGAMTHKPGWPKYLVNGKSSAHITLPRNALVTVVLRSYDNGTAPPPAHFAKVDGTVGGIVKVNGKRMTSVPVKDIAHTFTVIGLDLNVPVPAVTGKAKYLTETFQFVTSKAGTFSWQCYAPCGTGSAGWDGAMVTPGYMMGLLTVK